MRYYITNGDNCICGNTVSICKVYKNAQITQCIACKDITKFDENYSMDEEIPDEYVFKIRKKVFDLLYSN